MKKIVLCLVFLTASVQADILDSLTHYRTAIRMSLSFATTSTALSDTLLNTMVRQAVVRVNNEIGGYQVSTTLLLTPLSFVYTFDSTIQPQEVIIKRYDTTKSLLYVPMAKWSEKEHRQTRGQTDPMLRRPSYYDFIHGSILVTPTPYFVDTLLVIGTKKFPNVQTAQAFTQIPERYRDLILLDATWRVAKSRQHPLAAAFQQEYEQAKAKLLAKEQDAKARVSP